MSKQRIRDLEERFKRGCDLAPREIAQLFAYIARLETSGVRFDWQAHLEEHGWIRALSGVRRLPR